ncbi:MAG: hypothetical protein NT086_16690 [Proteobacteria bacterium]|nr:hypothetical protein [Pseudomonadota bacterium]
MQIIAPEMDNSWATNTGEKLVEKSVGNDTLTEGLYDDFLCKELIQFVD